VSGWILQFLKVMIRKAFELEWIARTRVMQRVIHEHLAINIHGEQGSFFRTSRWMRQGDPLSPILRDLVPAVPTDFAKSLGHIILWCLIV
jgi:hypothetical protein